MVFLSSCAPTFMVVFSGSTGGSVSNLGGEYEEGETITVTAQPDSEYVFERWSDGSTQNPRSIQVIQALNLTAIFIKKQYEIDVTVEGEGTVKEEVIIQGGKFNSGSQIKLTASPSNGWDFSNWKVNGNSDSTNPLIVDSNEDKTIVAVFQRKKFNLDISLEGEGSVIEEIIVSSSQYDYETQIKLTATPIEGWEFVEWSGDVIGSENPIVITLTEDTQLNAKFQKSNYNIDISGGIAKGAFLTGSSLTFYELNNSLSQTGKSYNTTISDDAGTFNLNVEQITEDYARVVGTGSYWNEISNSNTQESITLNSVAQIKENINVNVLTHLEYDRVLELVKNGGITFIEAKNQALEEVLTSFGITYSLSNGVSEEYNFKDGDESSRVLVAISSIVQSNRSPSEVSSLITKISNDLKNDGKIDDNGIKIDIAKNLYALDISQISENVYEKYKTINSSLKSDSFFSNYIDKTKETFSSFIPDTDGDGIEDGLDLCPETPSDETSDANGCSKSQKEYSLTTNVEGKGSIAEEVIVASAVNSYDYGTTVRVTATPETGWEFSEWKGDIISSENPISITITEPKEITAVFKRKQFDVTVTIQGKGTVNQELVVQSTKYDYESQVKLTAVPSDGWQFSGWSGDVSSTVNPLTISVDRSKNLTAIFIRKKFNVNVTIEGNGTVSQEVVVQPLQYDYETQVKLTPIPMEGWEFDSWKGDASGTSNPLVITVDKEKSITASFKRKKFDLTISLQGEGTVTEELVVPSTKYDYESQLKLTAVPSDGWRFYAWSGDVTLTQNPVTITMNGNKSVTAIFRPEDFDGDGLNFGIDFDDENYFIRYDRNGNGIGDYCDVDYKSDESKTKYIFQKAGLRGVGDSSKLQVYPSPNPNNYFADLSFVFTNGGWSQELNADSSLWISEYGSQELQNALGDEIIRWINEKGGIDTYSKFATFISSCPCISVEIE